MQGGVASPPRGAPESPAKTHVLCGTISGGASQRLFVGESARREPWITPAGPADLWIEPVPRETAVVGVGASDCRWPMTDEKRARHLEPHREQEMARQVAAAMSWPAVDFREYFVSCGTLRKLPAELCCRLRCAPIIFNSRRVVLAVDNLFHAAYLLANPQLLGPPYRHDLEFAFTSPSSLDLCLHKRITVVKG